LLDDKFPAPRPLTAPGKAVQCQGVDIREADQTPVKTGLSGGIGVQVRYSPNTIAKKKATSAPLDLEMLFDLMSKAKQAIFFLAFLPSRAGADSIISATIDASKGNKSLVVAGAISDVTAMPGYVPGDKKTGKVGEKPYTYEPRRAPHCPRSGSQ
jgi:hypothetical protein